jgi:hypothetical protein
MKRLIMLLCCLVSIQAYAQHSFSITQERKVIWQKVYDSPISINEYQQWLFNSGQYHDIAMYDNTITCWMNENPINYEKHGFDMMSDISMQIRDNNLTGFVTIQFKEGRYRVTIEQMQFIHRFDSQLYRKGEVTHMELLINAKGTFRKMAENNTLMVLEVIFADMFEYKKSAHLDDEW